MTRNVQRNSQVVNSGSMNIGRIANLRAGGERGAGTAQSADLSCHDTIRTQILNWSSNCEVEMPGFAGKTGPIPTVRVVSVVKPIARSGFVWNRNQNRPGNLEPLLTLFTGYISIMGFEFYLFFLDMLPHVRNLKI